MSNISFSSYSSREHLNKPREHVNMFREHVNEAVRDHILRAIPDPVKQRVLTLWLNGSIYREIEGKNLYLNPDLAVNDHVSSRPGVVASTCRLSPMSNTHLVSYPDDLSSESNSFIRLISCSSIIHRLVFLTEFCAPLRICHSADSVSTLTRSTCPSSRSSVSRVITGTQK